MYLGLGIYLVFGVGFDSSLPQKALHAPEWTMADTPGSPWRGSP